MRKKLKKGETKRGIGPAGGAPVSKKTGKVYTGKEKYKKYIKRGLDTMKKVKKP